MYILKIFTFTKQNINLLYKIKQTKNIIMKKNRIYRSCNTFVYCKTTMKQLVQVMLTLTVVVDTLLPPLQCVGYNRSTSEGDITDQLNSMLKRFTLSDKLLFISISYHWFSLKFYTFKEVRTCYFYRTLGSFYTSI
jgi:hypothetical protein